MASVRKPASIPARSKWASVWSRGIRDLGEPTPAEQRMLERMVLNLMAADAALASATREPYVEGSQGQPVEHPGFKIAARADGQALGFARQLRLTPLARSSGRQSAESKPEDPFAALDAEDELARRRQKRGAAT